MEKGLNTEMFADFGFLNRDSEVSTSETRGSYKFLALKETFSSSGASSKRQSECL